MSFGRTIADARKTRTMSQKELADKIKKEDGEPISPQYLNDIERDRRSPSSDYLIDQFASVLEIERERLYYWVSKIPEDMKPKHVPDKQIVGAYQAFRKAIEAKKSGPKRS